MLRLGQFGKKWSTSSARLKSLCKIGNYLYLVVDRALYNKRDVIRSVFHCKAKSSFLPPSGDKATPLSAATERGGYKCCFFLVNIWETPVNICKYLRNTHIYTLLVRVWMFFAQTYLWNTNTHVVRIKIFLYVQRTSVKLTHHNV